MASKRKKPVSSELAQSWLRHRSEFQSLMSNNANDASTWLWAIRIKILDFLIHQYTDRGSDSASMPSNDNQEVHAQTVHRKESDLGWSLPQTPPPVGNASRFRSLLHGIHDANSSRQEVARLHYEAVQQEKQEAQQRIREHYSHVREKLKAEFERKRKKLRKRLAKAEKRRIAEQAIRDAVVNLSYPDDQRETNATEAAMPTGINEEHDRCVNDNLPDIRAMIDDMDLIDPSDEPLSDDEIIRLLEL